MWILSRGLRQCDFRDDILCLPPAPVKTMKCLLFLIRFAKAVAFRTITLASSKISVGATLSAVHAILDCVSLVKIGVHV